MPQKTWPRNGRRPRCGASARREGGEGIQRLLRTHLRERRTAATAGEPRVCGDDEGAKETVAGLLRDVGLEPVDVGGLDQAANVEAFARMNVNLGFA